MVLPADNYAQSAVRSAPNQDRRSARFIGDFRKKARQIKEARFGLTWGQARCLSARFSCGKINRQGMAIAFVFPGQGSQTVGMGQALAANFAPARQIFDEVDGALGSKLSAIIFEGPADTLTLTENAQPALMAVSLAVMRVLEAEAGLDLG